MSCAPTSLRPAADFGDNGYAFAVSLVQVALACRLRDSQDVVEGPLQLNHIQIKYFRYWTCDLP